MVLTQNHYSLSFELTLQVFVLHLTYGLKQKTNTIHK